MMFLVGVLECEGRDEFDCIADKIETGTKRLGTQSLSKNAGVMVIFAVFLIALNFSYVS